MIRAKVLCCSPVYLCLPLFMEEAGRIYIMNSSMDALREAQRAFAGEADRLGLKNDDDVMAMIKEIR